MRNQKGSDDIFFVMDFVDSILSQLKIDFGYSLSLNIVCST